MTSTRVRAAKYSCQLPFDDTFKDHRESTKRETYRLIHELLRSSPGVSDVTPSPAAAPPAAASAFAGAQPRASHICSPLRTPAPIAPTLMPDDIRELFRPSPGVSDVTPSPAAAPPPAVAASAFTGAQPLASHIFSPLRTPAPIAATLTVDDSQVDYHKNTNNKRPYNNQTTHQETFGGRTIAGIPNLATLVAKSRLKTLLNKANAYDRLVRSLTTPGLVLKDDARLLLGMATTQVPGGSHYGLEPAIALIQAALVVRAGLDISLEAVAEASPTSSTLAACSIHCAVECLAALRNELRSAEAVFIGCDKGHRKGIEHLAKGVSWYCFREECVKVACLDSDGSGSETADVAESIKRSVEQKLEGVVSGFAGQSTDSGGGGVLDDLARKLWDARLITVLPAGAEVLDNAGVPDSYMVAPCSLHAWQKPFDNGLSTAFAGDGGIEKRNLSQGLFCCYETQQRLGDEFGPVWDLANPASVEKDDDSNEDGMVNIKKIGKPITNRWWNFPIACIHVLLNRPGWINVTNRCRNTTKSSVLLCKVASDAHSLLMEEEIWCDGQFVAAFSTSIFMKEFRWFQDRDIHADTWGHRSRHMAEHWFVIRGKLDKMRRSWRSMPEFQQFRKSCEELAKQKEDQAAACLSAKDMKKYPDRRLDFSVDMEERKADLFLTEFCLSAEKHFERWVKKSLITCAFGGEDLCAQALAMWVLENKRPKPSQEWRSEVHDATIDLCAYVAYVADNTPRQDILVLPWVTKHQEGLRLMANGHSLWNSELADMVAFRRFVKSNILPLMSSTHRIEFLVRETSIVAISGRGEGMRSALVLARSAVNPEVTRHTMKIQEKITKRAPRGTA